MYFHKSGWMGGYYILTGYTVLHLKVYVYNIFIILIIFGTDLTGSFLLISLCSGLFSLCCDHFDVLRLVSIVLAACFR